MVDENKRRENSKSISHVFKIGDMVNIINHDLTKLKPRTHGPHEIIQVFRNRTVRIRKDEFTEETVNIRKLFPNKK